MLNTEQALVNILKTEKENKYCIWDQHFEQ